MAEKNNIKKEEVKDYSSMKRAELLALAKDLGARVNTKTKKADLIAAIEAITKEAAEPHASDAEAEAPGPETEEAEITTFEETAEEPEEENTEPSEDEKAETDPEAEDAEDAAAEDTAEGSEQEQVEPAEDEKAEANTEATPDLKASTERKRQIKAERREAKAARKEANKAEEKKKRPSNLLIAILIFGVLIGMFAFIGGYNYFSKPASIEAYMDEMGMADMYTNVQYDEHSKITVRADGNTLKMLIKVDEDTGDEDLEEYKGDDATEDLKEMGAGFLTSLKPEVRGFGGTVKVGVKKGDETINYVKLSYSEAKKLMKELQEEAEEEADDVEDASDGADDAAEEAADEASED